MTMQHLFFLLVFPVLLFSKTITHFVLDSPSYIQGAGMFHNFNIVLGCLDLYDSKENMALTIDFKKEGLYYEKRLGDNWWSYYFEHSYYPCRITTRGHQVIKRLKDFEKAAFGNGVHFYFQRKKAHDLIAKYIRVKKEILKEVEEFEKKFHGTVIGVHYRATDKWLEADYVDPLYIVSLLQKELKQHDDTTLFIATDDAKALEIFRAYFPTLLYKEHERSHTSNPVHYNTFSPSEQGKEALIDMLLLSKVDKLYRTNSNLSAVSAFFNCEMEVINLNQPHLDFLKGVSAMGELNSLNIESEIN